MKDDTKRKLLQWIEMLPAYDDPAWNDDLDGCKLDVDFARRKLLKIVRPTNKTQKYYGYER